MLLRFSYRAAITSVDHTRILLSIQDSWIQDSWIASSATPPRNDDARGYARALLLNSGQNRNLLAKNKPEVCKCPRFYYCGCCFMRFYFLQNRRQFMPSVE